jgi:hypothetical protein
MMKKITKNSNSVIGDSRFPAALPQRKELLMSAADMTYIVSSEERREASLASLQD